MPRGYRSVIVVAVGFLAVLPVGYALQPEQPQLTGDSGYQEQAASYRAGGAQCEPSAIARLAARKRADKAGACEQAEEQHREAANNLIEARRSASAADASAIATYQQARIAAWATALGLATLLAAIAAAWFAKRAADETMRSANIAEDNAQDTIRALAIAARNADTAQAHVDVATRTAERQLRAYVYLDNARVTDVGPVSKGRELEFFFEFKNYGSTPATNVTLFAGYSFDEIPLTLMPVFQNPTKCFDIPPTGVLQNKQKIPFAVSALQKISEMKHAVYVYARVVYTTYDLERTTQIFIYSYGDDIGRQQMRPYPDNNYAT